MINNPPPPCAGLNIRIPRRIPTKGRGLLISGLGYYSDSSSDYRCSLTLVVILLLMLIVAVMWCARSTSKVQSQGLGIT